MTDLRSPVDSFGRDPSQYTKQKAADAAKRAQSNSELVRGLLIAMAIPLSAGAVYLLLSGQDVRIEGLTSSPVAAAPVPNAASVSATLPPPIGAEIVPTGNPHGSTAIVAGPTNPVDRTIATSGSSLEPQELKLELDSSGQLKSPYTVVLDENGREVSRKEFSEFAMFLPLLPLGPFEGAKTLSTAEVPADFSPKQQVRPFVYSEIEHRRLAALRATAPEIRRAIDNLTSLSSSRMTMSPAAVESFSDSRLQAAAENAKIELRWLKAAAVTRDLLGDRTPERRLVDSLLTWARTYKPSGDAVAELPLLDAVYAYNSVRHLYRTPDQAEIDAFFKQIIDLQFIRQKSNKVYNESHAAHILMTAAVGYVIENSAFQLHAITQYKYHVEKSLELKQSAPGDDEVKSLASLLETAYIFDRAGMLDYRSPQLHAASAAMVAHGKTTDPLRLVDAVASAAYFDPTFYRRLITISAQAGVTGTRFGTDNGAFKAALRKPTSSLTAPALRLPTSAPTKLPPKRK